MQIDIKQINATSKEIDLRVEAEKVDQAYQKYQANAARNIEVPGFRKGKAPLSMVTKLHGDRIIEYFEKDYVDEVFTEAAREKQIHFLLYPEVKELNWEPGSDMTIKFEIEHEPTVEIAQTEGLQVPFRPILLEDEVHKFIDRLAEEHTTAIDVETAADNDYINVHLNVEPDGQARLFNVNVYAGTDYPQRSLPEMIGARINDKVSVELTGTQIKLLAMQKELDLDNETSYPCSLTVNAILRYSKPALDDEFAKDMDFENMDEMKAKIGEDLSLGLEHHNIEGENSAIIAKLFKDNPFPLPPKTLRYIVQEEVEKMDPKYREILYQYYIQNIVQEMTTLYIMKALRKQQALEISPEMLEQYIQHRAILEDVSVGAFKDKNADKIASEDFPEAVQNYFILRQIASSSEFTEPVEEQDEQSAEELESSDNTPNKEGSE
ncbi:MAG: hypothetical protein K0B87_08910 [Candidatus Syntrophosphaera sp.]|nr:hypothetical protein [Candidatus Syntrophosphaera sp.]